jgi:hypothetical protein
MLPRAPWKIYNIRYLLENIRQALQQITANNMRGVWKRLIVQIVVRNRYRREGGFGGPENEDVWELLSSHLKELTDGFLLLDHQKASEKVDSDAEELENVQVREFNLKEFEDVFRAAEIVKQKIMDAVPNLDRSMQIRRDTNKALCVYQYMYEDLKKEKTVQSTLLKYFER